MRISDWSSDVCSSDLLLQGLGLGLGDLLDRSLLATRQGLFQIFGGLAAQQLGLVLGVGQQILGLLGGIALLALVFGQRLLRFLAQALGLVELGADALGAGVETIEDGLARLPDHQRSEEHTSELQSLMRIS